MCPVLTLLFADQAALRKLLLKAQADFCVSVCHHTAWLPAPGPDPDSYSNGLVALGCLSFSFLTFKMCLTAASGHLIQRKK